MFILKLQAVFSLIISESKWQIMVCTQRFVANVSFCPYSAFFFPSVEGLFAMKIGSEITFDMEIFVSVTLRLYP